MNLIAIETSTDLASVALCIENTYREVQQEGVQKHGECILTMVHTLLEEAQVALSALDGIVFGRGPGSFTGLRIACSVAKGLAFGQDLPLYPVSTLASIAYQAQEMGTHNVLALLDARMHQVYWGYYAHQTYVANEAVSNAEDIHASEPCVLAGVGFEPFLEKMTATVRKAITSMHLVYPQAKSMIQLVQAGAYKAIAAEAASPVYIRNQVT